MSMLQRPGRGYEASHNNALVELHTTDDESSKQGDRSIRGKSTKLNKAGKEVTHLHDNSYTIFGQDTRSKF